VARHRLEKLRAETRDAMLRRSIDRRLCIDQAPAILSPSGEAVLKRLINETIGETRLAAPSTRRWRAAPAVWALDLCFNVAMFGVEMVMGGATNTAHLAISSARSNPEQ
jgi:hypothetical protein